MNYPMGFKKAWKYNPDKKSLITDVEFLEGTNDKETENIY